MDGSVVGADVGLEGELDSGLLGDLVEDYGDGLLAEIAASLDEEAETAIAAFRAGSERDDAPARAMAAHALKGTALTVGMVRLARVAEEAEIAARAGLPADPGEAGALALAWHRARAAFGSYMEARRAV